MKIRFEVGTCALIACLSAACNPATAPIAGDACEAACQRRAELGCLEAALATQCVPVCQRATTRGLFDPACAARAEDIEAMARCNVRCGR